MLHITNENKIDMLELLPKVTKSKYNVSFAKFNHGKEEWFILRYGHPRAKELEVKRYINLIDFGKLLGQMQAEGSKTEPNILEFSNESILEHKDFVNSLKELGITLEQIVFRLVDSGNSNIEKLNNLAKAFEKEIGIYPKIESYFSKRGGLCFKSICRNTLLSQLVLDSMDLVRQIIPKQYVEMKELADAFISKLLTGDGTLNIDKREPVPRIYIAIKDQNSEYLKDYKRILLTAGFKGVRIFEKHITVRAYCSFENLFYLYKIRAFYNINNWNKLLVSIGLCLAGRRLNKIKIS